MFSYLPFDSTLRLRSVLHILVIEFEDCFVSKDPRTLKTLLFDKYDYCKNLAKSNVCFNSV